MFGRLAAVAGMCAVCVAILSSCPAESAATPERIYSKRIRFLSPERYTELRDEWKAYTESHPKDPMGWTELAKAARYAGEPCETYLEYAKKAVAVGPDYADAHGFLGGYNWKMYCPSSAEDPSASIAELERALSLDPSNGEPHYTLWVMKLSEGKREEAASHLVTLLREGQIPDLLVDLAYNMLVAVEPNAIILTNGDNDTYPPLALQAARSFRPDVAIVNLSLLNTSWYRKEMKEGPQAVPVPEIDESAKGPQAGAAVSGIVQSLRADGWKRPLYVAVTVYRQGLPFKNRLSLEGVVYRVLPEEGEEAVDAAKLAENLEHVYRLESATSLGTDWDHFSALPPLVVNYAAAYTQLGAALAGTSDLDGARAAFREGLRLLEFHGRKDLGKKTAETWAGVDPGSTEPASWIKKFAD
jgi:tetratricopeptide (TPR) repeat protein